MSNAKRLLSHYGGKTDWFHPDIDGKGGYGIETIYQLEPIIERAKYLSEQTPGKEFRHVALIPQHVVDQASRDGWLNDKQKWKDWCNNADNRMFRTWPGKL